jgi:hypothetical protein
MQTLLKRLHWVDAWKESHPAGVGSEDVSAPPRTECTGAIQDGPWCSQDGTRDPEKFFQVKGTSQDGKRRPDFHSSGTDYGREAYVRRVSYIRRS